MTDQEQLALLRLNLVRGCGPRLQSLLLARFGSASAVFGAAPSDLTDVRGIGAELLSEFAKVTELQAEREFERCRATQMELFFRGETDYPRRLDEVPDAPPVLYCRGSMEHRDELALAIVGSRQCSIYGRQQAERFAQGLSAAGVTVISGLARGIDAAAHRGALEGGGRTIAVCATGLDRIYPTEHESLASEIIQQGAIVSESPLGRGPSRGIFPQRNRIISGLSLGVLVIEARRKSGALHTTRHAMEQGRDVLAVPGRVDNLASEGCHDLIRDGAILVRNVDDVLEALGPLAAPVQRSEGDLVAVPRELSLSEQERSVLNLVTAEPQHLDVVVQSSDLEPSRVLATLTVLEMKHAVRRLPGGYVVRFH